MVQDPLLIINQWLEKEKELGSASPDRMVLATASSQGIPHSRIVAVREISSDGVLFFTQRNTRKVTELNKNPYASMTLWLELQQRQVNMDGFVKPLTHAENKKFWDTIPRERQLRFSAYASTSGQAIHSTSILENQLNELTKNFLDKPIPMSDHYCGFYFIAESIYFYTLGNDTFSEFIRYKRCQASWDRELLSP